jgi:hypothetical protein
LTEGDVTYSPYKINRDIGECWAEGVSEQGIHESIIFLENMQDKFKNVFISIDFVSYNKPYLYRQNSRPKTIKITIGEGKPVIHELQDTPNYQPLVLPCGYTGKIKLEILEVYEGTKYEDTCINDLLLCFIE